MFSLTMFLFRSSGARAIKLRVLALRLILSIQSVPVANFVVHKEFWIASNAYCRTSLINRVCDIARKAM